MDLVDLAEWIIEEPPACVVVVVVIFAIGLVFTVWALKAHPLLMQNLNFKQTWSSYDFPYVTPADSLKFGGMVV